MIRVKGLQHIGITVPDLEEAVNFFEQVFGAVTVMSTGPIDVDDTFMITKLGVPGDRRIKDIKVLRCGNGTNLELFEYQGEVEPSTIKLNSQVGGFHLAFEVEDVYESVGRLKEMGVDVLEGPTFIEDGPMAGLHWVYLKAPWGQYLELISIEGTLGYEATTEARLWAP